MPRFQTGHAFVGYSYGNEAGKYGYTSDGRNYFGTHPGSVIEQDGDKGTHSKTFTACPATADKIKQYAERIDKLNLNYDLLSFRGTNCTKFALQAISSAGLKSGVWNLPGTEPWDLVDKGVVK